MTRRKHRASLADAAAGIEAGNLAVVGAYLERHRSPAASILLAILRAICGERSDGSVLRLQRRAGVAPFYRSPVPWLKTARSVPLIRVSARDATLAILNGNNALVAQYIAGLPPQGRWPENNPDRPVAVDRDFLAALAAAMHGGRRFSFVLRRRPGQPYPGLLEQNARALPRLEVGGVISDEMARTGKSRDDVIAGMLEGDEHQDLEQERSLQRAHREFASMSCRIKAGQDEDFIAKIEQSQSFKT